MTKRDIASMLGVDVQTLRNWKKTRPNLYRIIMQGIAIDEAIQESKEHYERLRELADRAINTELKYKIKFRFKFATSNKANTLKLFV